MMSFPRGGGDLGLGRIQAGSFLDLIELFDPFCKIATHKSLKARWHENELGQITLHVWCYCHWLHNKSACNVTSSMLLCCCRGRV